MKRIVNVLALVSLLGIMATACQKETSLTPLPTIVTRTVDYRVGNGDIHRATFHGDVQWDTFLAAIFDSVDHGHRVTLSHGATTAKEVVTFSSAVKSEAMAWVDSMYNAGYDVVLWYDNETHQYNAAAQKSSGSTQDTTPILFTFRPFAEYLPGTWVVAKDIYVTENMFSPTMQEYGWQAPEDMTWTNLARSYFEIHHVDNDYIHGGERYRSLRFTADSVFEETPYPNPVDSANRYTSLMARYTDLDSVHLGITGQAVYCWLNNGMHIDTVDLGDNSNFGIFEWNTDSIIFIASFTPPYPGSTFYPYFMFVRKHD